MKTYRLHPDSKPRPSLPELIVVGLFLLAIGALMGFYAGMYAIEHYLKSVGSVESEERKK